MTRDGSFARKLGLHRPQLRAWALYDWANSAMAAVIVTSIFPTYYSKVAGAGMPETLVTQRYAVATTLSLTIIAVLAPILGALADLRALRKRMLTVFLSVGVSSAAAMYFIHTGDLLLASVLFVLCNIGASGSFVFYDSLLPHVARPDEIDRVSTAGYALGYLGGGLLLGLNLAWIQYPQWFGLPSGDDLSDAQSTLPVRLAFVSVAVWWALFSLPLLRRVPEPPPTALPGSGSTVQLTWAQLRRTFQELRRYRNAGLLLLAFLIYNDGILTIIRMATIYGAEVGIDTSVLLAVILLSNFLGVPFAFFFGWLASRWGAKNCIYLTLAIFVVVSYLGYRMRTATEFLILGILVSMVLGGTQALSRSLFASMIPRDQSSEFFGFFAVTEKFAGILGPAVFAIMITLTGSSRGAILALASFFIVGAWLLRGVDVTEGRRVAASAATPASPTDTPASR